MSPSADYAWSHFNMALPTTEEGHLWLYNTFYGGLIHISGIRQCCSPDQHDEDELALLRANGFLVHETCDEVLLAEELLEGAKWQTGTLTVTIAPTMRCNFSCPYCFERATPLWNSSGTVDRHTQEDIQSYILSNLAGRRRLAIRWFGGEPLLAADAIRFMSDRLFEVCSSANIAYESTITTNGYLLDRDQQSRLLASHVGSIQVTLDGDLEHHDRTRHLAEGRKSTFATILSNIQSAAELFQLDIRVNVSRYNLSSIPRLLERLASNHATRRAHVHFHPIYRLCSGRASISADAAVGFSGVSDFALEEMKLIECACSLGLPFSWTFAEPVGLPCSAVKVDAFMIDPTGDIVKCDHELGSSSAIMGSVTRGLGDLRRLEAWSRVNPRDNPLCPSCAVLPTCLGYCESIRRHVTPEEACPSKKYNFADRMRLGISILRDSSPLSHVGRIDLYRKPTRTPKLIGDQMRVGSCAS